MLTLEVVYLEDRSTGFSSSSLELRAVDLNEPIFIQVFAEQIPNRMLESEDSLVCCCLWLMSEMQDMDVWTSATNP